MSRALLKKVEVGVGLRLSSVLEKTKAVYGEWVLINKLGITCQGVFSRIQVSLPESVVPEDFEVLVQEKSLKDLLEDLGDAFEVEQTRTKNVVRSGGFTAKLLSLSPEQFPPDVEDADLQNVEMLLKNLRSAFQAVDIAVASEVGRNSEEVFRGLTLRSREAGLYAIGAQPTLVARARVGDGIAGLDVTMPREIGSIIDHIPGDVLRLSWSKTDLLLTSPTTRVRIRRLAGSLPNTDPVFGRETIGRVVVARELLRGAIRRTSVTKEKHQKFVNVHFEPEALTIKSRSPETGFSEEKIPVTSSAPAITLGVNLDQVQDILRKMGGDDVALEVGKDGDFVAIRTPDADFMSRAATPDKEYEEHE